MRPFTLAAPVAVALTLASLGAPALTSTALAAQPASQQMTSGPLLSAQQKAKAKAIDAATRSQMMALQTNKSLSDAQKQQKAQAIMQSYKAQMIGLLTPAQHAEFTRNQGLFTAKMKQIKQLNEDINKSLTPAQKQRIAGITAGTQAEMKKIVDDKSIPNTVKTVRLQTLQQQGRAKVMTLLTPAQKANADKIGAIEKSLPHPQR